MSYQSEVKLYQAALAELMSMGYSGAHFVPKSQEGTKATLKSFLRHLEIDGKTKEILSTDENWALAAKVVADIEDDLDLSFTKPGQDWITDLKHRAYYAGQKYEHALIHGGHAADAVILEGIDATMLKGLQDNGYELIQGVAADQVELIRRTLTEGILHNKLHSEVQDSLIRDGKIPALIVEDKNGVKRFLEMEWRIEMIDRTETSRVAELGRKDKAKEFYGDELWGRWHTTKDGNERAHHRLRDGLAMSLADWEAGIGPDSKAIMPGEEVNCRCWMEWGTAEDMMRRQGLKVDPPKPPTPPAEPKAPKIPKGKKPPPPPPPKPPPVYSLESYGNWGRADPAKVFQDYRTYEAACKRGMGDDVVSFKRLTMQEVQMIDDKIAKGTIKPQVPLEKKAWTKKMMEEWDETLDYLEANGVAVNDPMLWDEATQTLRKYQPNEFVDGVSAGISPYELQEFKIHYDGLSAAVKDSIKGLGGSGKGCNLHLSQLAGTDPDMFVYLWGIARNEPSILRRWYGLPQSWKPTKGNVAKVWSEHYNSNVGGVHCPTFANYGDDVLRGNTNIFCQSAYQYSQEGSVLHHEVGHYLDDIAGRWSYGGRFETAVIKKGKITIQKHPFGGKGTKVIKQMRELTGRNYGARPAVPQEVWADMNSLYNHHIPRTFWEGHPEWSGKSGHELLKEIYPEAWELMKRVNDGVLDLGTDKMLVDNVFNQLGIGPMDNKAKAAWFKKHAKKGGFTDEHTFSPAQLKKLGKQFGDEIPDDLAAALVDGGPATEVPIFKLPPGEWDDVYQGGVGYIRPEAIGTPEAYAELIRASVNRELLFREGHYSYLDLIKLSRIPDVAVMGGPHGMRAAIGTYDVVENMLVLAGQTYKQGMTATQHLEAVMKLGLKVREWDGVEHAGALMTNFQGKLAPMAEDDIWPFLTLWRRQAGVKIGVTP